jgi:hypothetical protein
MAVREVRAQRPGHEPHQRCAAQEDVERVAHRGVLVVRAVARIDVRRELEEIVVEEVDIRSPALAEIVREPRHRRLGEARHDERTGYERHREVIGRDDAHVAVAGLQ